MDEYYLSTVDSSTVADFLSVNINQDAADSINRNINNGGLKIDQMYIFGREKSVKATFILSDAPIVVPRIAFSMSEADIRIFATMLCDLLTAREKIVIIDKHLAAVNIDAFTNSGWTLTGHDKLYQTDLTSRDWKLDPEVTEIRPTDLLSVDMRDFYKSILEEDEYIGDTGSNDPLEAFDSNISDEDMRLFVIKDQNMITAAATLFSTILGEVNIHLLGVIPSARGKGIGQRIHAHLLAVAKKSAKTHVGGTKADNFAMHKIYEKNGARMVAEQFQLRL